MLPLLVGCHQLQVSAWTCTRCGFQNGDAFSLILPLLTGELCEEKRLSRHLPSLFPGLWAERQRQARCSPLGFQERRLAGPGFLSTALTFPLAPAPWGSHLLQPSIAGGKADPEAPWGSHPLQPSTARGEGDTEAACLRFLPGPE